MSPGLLDAWPPLPPAAFARRRRTVLPFPLDSDDCTLYARGRHALWQGVRALGLVPGDHVLVPAYHHGSEIEALTRAGLICRFYGRHSPLTPDPDELDRLLHPGVRALHLVHYLGFPQDVAMWRRWCDERGLLLLEDAAQAWLATRDGVPVGTLGDLAIFCLYKTYGLPDGAALVTREPVAPPDGRPARQWRRLLRRQAAWLAQQATVAGRPRVAPPSRADYDHRQDFALGSPVTPVSAITRFLLPRLADPGTRAQRQANFAALGERLGHRLPPGLPPGMPAGMAAPDDGAAPFAFPLLVDDKFAVLDHLAAHGIRALDLWRRPHPSLDAAAPTAAGRLRQQVIGLPVHQELTAADIARLADVVEDCLGVAVG